MATIPHLMQYQGSKRNIAPEILKYFPNNINRLIEPFAGTCAISILTAYENRCDHFLVNDINIPLIQLMEQCINNPSLLSETYTQIWNGQFADGQNNVDYYYKIREEFNTGMMDPARMLFLLARVVKGAIRYNTQGMMNQACDKRRNGTRPGDLIYLDPPYQGTSRIDTVRDNRYIQGVSYEEFVGELEKLNHRGINYIVSYDGMTGGKQIGKKLPDTLNLTHLYINAGVSAQSTLNGKKEITYESLYLSSGIKQTKPDMEQLRLHFS